MLRARSISARRLRLGTSEANAGGRLAHRHPGRCLRGADRRGVSRRRLRRRGRSLSSSFWGERMRTPARPLRDPKTMLQEWAQARGLPTPTYREVERTGPHHDPEFRVAVDLPDASRPKGVGRSKRAAEQAAAAAMLSARASRRTPMAEDAAATAEDTRCGFVALIGAPNAGKSTLINALVGSKVSIVTHKVQTTRTLVRGIAIEGAAQLVFVDTPGHFRAAAPARPRHGDDRLERRARCRSRRAADRRQARASMTRPRPSLNKLAEVRQPKVLILNKVDLVEKASLLALAQARERAAPIRRDLHGFGAQRRRRRGSEALACRAGAGRPLALSGRPDFRRAAAPARRRDHAREAFLRLHQELPYQSTVETETWKERKDGSVRIEQTIYVERESQRKIVLGKGGQTIKAIGADGARGDRGDPREAGAPVSVRESARGLGRRSGALPADGAGISQGMNEAMIARARYGRSGADGGQQSPRALAQDRIHLHRPTRPRSERHSATAALSIDDPLAVFAAVLEEPAGTRDVSIRPRIISISVSPKTALRLLRATSGLQRPTATMAR